MAGLLAVGGGSLLISLAFELYEPSVSTLGRWQASVYFLFGVVVFGGLDILIERVTDEESEQEGLGL